MLDNSVNVKNKNNILNHSQNSFLTIFAFLLFLSGIIGPGFWKIESPKFYDFVNEKNYTRASINLKKLDKYSLALDNLNLNTESLSSDDILVSNISSEDKDSVFKFKLSRDKEYLSNFFKFIEALV